MALAYGANADLIFDTERLADAGKRYGQAAGKLRAMASGLDELLNDLSSSGWTSPAGMAFCEMADTNWKENIEKYASLLESLDEILDEAAKEYEDLAVYQIEAAQLKLC